jgi:phosphoribosylformylglycinamidine synthase subunit PurQ / glutaminase
MKTGIIEFPGSNCDHDAFYTVNEIFSQPVEMLWHKDHRNLKEFDLIILPGGFSYGDYLRTGAIARFAPVMRDVIAFAEYGGTVIGICNGFQVLTECGLLPGALMRNRDLKFICKNVFLRVENNQTIFTGDYHCREVIHIPVAHGEGNYFADDDTLKQIEDENRVIFRYCSEDGAVSDRSNPNGSLGNIAGIINARGNVLGMMPHPERCSDPVLGNTDGARLFSSLMASIGTVLA